MAIPFPRAAHQTQLKGVAADGRTSDEAGHIPLRRLLGGCWLRRTGRRQRWRCTCATRGVHIDRRYLQCFDYAQQAERDVPVGRWEPLRQAHRLDWLGCHFRHWAGHRIGDNCSPNCAQGTYHSYPAVITVSDPRPWHRIIAYARVRASVAAIRYRYAFTRGLIPAAGQTPRPASTPSSPPAISASLLSTSCKLGYANGGTFEPNTAANWDAYPGYSAEMITLTNVGTSGVTLQGFKTQTTWRGQVVAAHQISSAPNLPEFLTPGQTYSN